MTDLPIQNYEREASRFELIVGRWLFFVPWVFTSSVSMVLISSLLVLMGFMNFASIITVGSRFKPFYMYAVKIQEFSVRSFMYFSAASDERPSWHPF